jgi:hypothetical protein
MKLITSKFKTHAAAQFLESFSEEANTIYYIGAHKSLPFTDDNSPPDISNSTSSVHYDLYDDLLFGKQVTPNDVKHMIRNVPWVSGTVYDKYDNTTESLETKNFFVVSPEASNYYVFKCLNNAGGRASTDQPLFSETAADDELYVTSDGYEWKYMYTITASEYSKFATSEYIPVIPDANVTANAIPGSITTIVVENGGRDYNSFAKGTIKEAAVNGNTLFYSLNAQRYFDFDVTVDDANGFLVESVSSFANGLYANGVILDVYTSNNTLRITNSSRSYTPGADITGLTSNTTAVIQSVTNITTALSSNTDFYKNNSIYIRSGTGAGQLRSISEYIVTGEERRVLVNAPFNPLPDTTSVYEIGPRVIINGDGVNANAVATVGGTSNSIIEIEMINSGSNYSYADITIIANTGLVSTTNTALNLSTSSAQARAIISPPGGHGSDVVDELFANRIGVGLEFANTESGTIPASNDYRAISLIKDPLFANVELTLVGTATNFTAGETVVQANTGATGVVTNRDTNTLRLTNVSGFFLTGNSTVNFITGQTSTNTDEVSAIDRSFTTFDQRQVYQVETINSGLDGTGFELDELVIQEGLQTLSSDVVSLTVNGGRYVANGDPITEISAYLFNDGEVITQNDTSATGTVTDRFNNTITLYNVDGTFLSGNSSINEIVNSSNTIALYVSEVDNTFQANALGYIHSLNSGGANSTVIGLTGVKGFFSISDDASGTINTFIGQDNQAVTKITGRDQSYSSIVDDSGKILYVENFSPIERASDQTEKIKLIIEF